MVQLIYIAMLAEILAAAYFGTMSERRRVCDMINQGIHNALAQPGGSYEMAPETVSYYAQHCREEEETAGVPQF